jgi:hypothetical protein
MPVPMAPADQIIKLEGSFRVYAELIESFDRVRERLLIRRRGTTDSVMVHLDESLSLNQRTLDSLRSVQETASTQLEQENFRFRK